MKLSHISVLIPELMVYTSTTTTSTSTDSSSTNDEQRRRNTSSSGNEKMRSTAAVAAALPQRRLVLQNLQRLCLLLQMVYCCSCCCWNGSSSNTSVSAFTTTVPSSSKLRMQWNRLRHRASFVSSNGKRYRSNDSGEMPTTTTAMSSTTNDGNKQQQQQQLQQQQQQQQKKKQLTRPERKALERQQKRKIGGNELKNAAPQKKGGNRIGRKKQQAASSSSNNKVRQASAPDVVKELELKTMDDVMKSIKRCQNSNNFELLQQITNIIVNDDDDVSGITKYGFRGSVLARIAVAALHFVHVFAQEQPERQRTISVSGGMAQEIADLALRIRQTQHADSIRPMESAALIRGFLRANNNVTMAWDIYHQELAGENVADEFKHETLQYRALALASIANRHYYNVQPYEAISTMNLLSELGSQLTAATTTADASYRNQITDAAEVITIPWTRLLHGAAACQVAIRSGNYKIHDNSSSSSSSNSRRKLPCNVVYSVLNAMVAHRAENSDDTYELLANALVRRVLFCTGAVSMEGCPDADRGEVCFLGRSNVGKSSLINMICNRKSIAFVSKRPGKTQQFNYFGVNDAPDKDKFVRYGDAMQTQPDGDTFYMVDLPGFGYAKVPDHVKAEWKLFMREYLATRPTLHVVFHLIDSRHGPTTEDAEMMQNVAGNLLSTAKYVVVLTKADKNVKGGSNNQKRKPGKVTDRILETVRSTMVENGVGSAPIILTSAETKLGRDKIWNYLRLAAEK